MLKATITALFILLLGGVSTFSAIAQEKQRVLLQARLDSEGPVIKDGVEWRIFSANESGVGELKELAYSFGGSKAFDIEPGDYFVHAAYGHAGAIKKISVGNVSLREEFTLNAGGLKLNATASNNFPIPSRLLRFDIYAEQVLENGNRKLLAKDVKPDEIIAFPVGTYHVISRFGDLNATVRADLQVRLGKMTEATMQHRAAILTFRLVRQAGGERWGLRAGPDRS